VITASRGMFCAKRECLPERSRGLQLRPQLQILSFTFASYVVLLYNSRNSDHFSR
jgi:hypothetical protein